MSIYEAIIVVNAMVKANKEIFPGEYAVFFCKGIIRRAGGPDVKFLDP